jgi:DNA-binding CsgD family transcriptional regulator
MSSILARCIGVTHTHHIALDVAIVILKRRSSLTRSEARLVVLDYRGWTREQMSAYLNLSVETVRTYWKRVYRKTDCRTRPALHNWLEDILQCELESRAQH